MEIKTIQIPSANLRETITTLINDYIRIEKNATGLAYQKESSFKMGQINIITQLMGEKWEPESGQSYYAFLQNLVEKYELSVWRISDLWEPKSNNNLENRNTSKN